jgi:hypothetical protein
MLAPAEVVIFAAPFTLMYTHTYVDATLCVLYQRTCSTLAPINGGHCSGARSQQFMPQLSLWAAPRGEIINISLASPFLILRFPLLPSILHKGVCSVD